MGPAGQGADEVVLGVQGDQDVLESLRLVADQAQGGQMGADDVGAGARGLVQVEAAGVALGAEGHAADVVDHGGPECSVEAHGPVERDLDGGHRRVPPRRSMILCADQASRRSSPGRRILCRAPDNGASLQCAMVYGCRLRPRETPTDVGLFRRRASRAEPVRVNGRRDCRVART